MKTNIKALELIEKGLSAKTVAKLDESQVNVLHSKLLNEQPQPVKTTKTVQQIVLPSGSQTTVGGVSVSNVGGKTTITPTSESDLAEDMDIDLTNDPDATDDGMGIFEKKEDDNKPNPWAICHSQVGPKKSRKWERCVKQVKKQLGEGKNPVSLFLENEIMKIVEKNLPPRITKRDLVNYLTEGDNFATKHIQDFKGTTTAPSKPKTSPTTKPGKPDVKPKPSHPGKNPNPGENPAPKAKKEFSEQNPDVAPSKPKTSPTTKPGKPDPKPRPKHPGKNPNPGENPAPKAGKVSPQDAKDKVIDVIMQLLEK
jgi:hypothetical protein